MKVKKRITEQRDTAAAAPPWKGRPVGPRTKKPQGLRSGLSRREPPPGSVVGFLKDRLAGRPMTRGDYKTLADELAVKLARMARGGSVKAYKEILAYCESRALTVDELNYGIERIYQIVYRHVSRLPGGVEAMTGISKEMMALQEEFETP